MTVEKPTTGRRVFLVLLAAACLHLLYYYPQLPDRVASHFDAAGRADGWSHKGALAFFYLGIMALMAGIAFAFSATTSRLPVRWISLPNRDYWLAPERREATLAVLSDLVFWFNSATVGFLMLLMHLTIRANLDGTHRLGDSFWPLLVAYLAFTAGWCVAMLRRFRKPPSSAPQ